MNFDPFMNLARLATDLWLSVHAFLALLLSLWMRCAKTQALISSKSLISPKNPYGKRPWERGSALLGSLEVSGDEGADSCHWAFAHTALAVVVGIAYGAS